MNYKNLLTKLALLALCLPMLVFIIPIEAFTCLVKSSYAYVIRITKKIKLSVRLIWSARGNTALETMFNITYLSKTNKRMLSVYQYGLEDFLKDINKKYADEVDSLILEQSELTKIMKEIKDDNS